MIDVTLDELAEWVITIKHGDGIFYPHAVGVACNEPTCALNMRRDELMNPGVEDHEVKGKGDATRSEGR